MKAWHVALAVVIVIVLTKVWAVATLPPLVPGIPPQL